MIANYAELKSKIASWLMRDDLTDEIPIFIQMAEEFCNSNLRTREMIKRVTLTANARYVDLPDDWRKAKNVQRVADDFALGIMAYDEIDKYRYWLAHNPTAEVDKGPRHFALVGETMELAPAPTASDPHDLEMIYYAKVPHLDGDTDTNWLLENYPSILIYGALIHSAPFLQDDARVATWGEMLRTAVESANMSDTDSRFSGAPLQRRIRGF